MMDTDTKERLRFISWIEPRASTGDNPNLSRLEKGRKGSINQAIECGP